ncbi:GIN domain-containing protein [Spirosoma arcticum]
MKTPLLIFALLLSIILQAQHSKYDASQEILGSGQVVQEIKRVEPFTEIQTRQFPAKITVEVGGSESSVGISLDDNLRQFLRIDQEDGILKLSFADPQGKPSWVSKSAISVTVRTPQLIRLRHGSNSDVLVKGLSGEWFDLANEANGNVTLLGKVTTFNVASAANGGIRADELITQTANVITLANATLRVNAQTVNEVRSGRAQIINVAKPTK